MIAINPLEHFNKALADVSAAWPALKPATHARVSQGAAAVLNVTRPGSAPEKMSLHDTAYMVEPMDTLGSRVHSAVCFVGPAQTGKTLALGEGWMAHAVTNDPGDMLIVQMTQDKAREYSRQRIDRALRESPELAKLLGRASDNNTHDKLFRNGMWVKIAWPTVSNLSSTSYRYVFLTDYDRMDDDIEGEGDAFTLAGKRTTTFGSRGMLAVESSPGRLIKDPHWKPVTPHEAPPVGGILGIYNRSDRRRQYWQCPHCQEFFQASPGLGLFHLDDDDTLLDSVRTMNIDRYAEQMARVICPNNGCVVTFDHRYELNKSGVWLPDGQTIDAERRLHGEARTSSIAGFWLGGVGAAYLTWESLIRKHLQALLEYALNGEEQPLLTTTNTDQGLPYLSMSLREKASHKPLKERADKEMQRYHVPSWARWLGATVDVQGGKRARFVVQVHAHGPDNQEAVVDRYDITWSARQGMGTEFAPIDPSGYPEDWDVLIDKVVNASYRTDDPATNLRVYRTMIDANGEGGVTENAYAFLRRLRTKGLSQRVILSKGEPAKVDWYIKQTMVGGKQGLNDVPLLLLSSNKLKDIVDGALKRKTPGAGWYHFPDWLPQSFYDELQAEIRSVSGKWEQIKPRNESLDLCYMQKALLIFVRGKMPTIDYEHPPHWAAPLDRNSETVPRDKPVSAPVAAIPQQAVQRRVSQSPYMR